MKKLIWLICALYVALAYPMKFVFAQTEYGQIITQGAPLYKTETLNNSYSDIYCQLEYTYYVNILYELNNCYKVNYNGIIGYASKSAIKRTLSIPQNPYPNNITLTCNQNCYMRTEPNQSNSDGIIAMIPINTQVRFVGILHGTNITDFGDDTWYYVSINDQYGYIFSGYFKSPAIVYPNTEDVSYVSDISQITNPLSDTKVAFIVTILTIPAIIIMVLLYIKPNIKHKIKVKH